MLHFILAGACGYFLGSFPTAFLVVRWTRGIDVRNAGSGNVGTLNSFEVTKSPAVGAAVLIADVLKGVAAVLVVRMLTGMQFQYEATAGLCVVLGHNYPLWLRFKGGRGLATAAGVTAILCWWVLALWCVLWSAGFALTRRVNIGSAIATVVSAVSLVALPEKMLAGHVPAGIVEFKIFHVLLFGMILLRLTGPIREYVRELRER